MQTSFYQLADFAQHCLMAGEVWLGSFAAEESHFVRLNKSAVRQAGSVRQMMLDFSLISEGRRAESHLTLSGNAESDRDLLRNAIQGLRRSLAHLPKDPYLLYNTEVQSSEHIAPSRLPADKEMLEQVLGSTQGKDMVGLYAGGTIYRGFANSLGQRNWHQVDNFNLEWCLYHAADKAVKSSYAGTHWDQHEFARKMQSASAQLAILSRPAKMLEPGEYRAFLKPAALNEIISLLSWGGFGVKSQRNKQSPLMKLEESSASLNAAVTLSENIAEGVAPGFQADGFIRPARVPLIHQGKHASALVSPRSAQEFSIAANGANAQESPESLDMAAGSLDESQALNALGDGLLIGNLWYLNYSDRVACRMTGMTRFATFWVENGQIVAPVNVMRFDDTAYRLLGENLEALTAERDWLLDSASYGARSTASARLPGALIRKMALTL